MNHIKKMLALCATTLLLAACGGGGSTSPASSPATIFGQVQQGNIKDAQVFLDLNGNGVLDSGEPKSSSLTDASGNFTLSLTSDDVAKLNANSSTAKLVSVGGTDTTTTLDAGLLVSDPPAISTSAPKKNVTPMTTLLALAPDAQTKSKLKALLSSVGAKDDGLIEGSSSATVALAKSVETALITLQKSVTTKANAEIAREVARKAVAEMGKALSGKSKDDIINTETLANALSFAAGTAVANTSELTVHTAQLTTAIFKGCKEAADAVKSKRGNTLATDDSSSEAEIMDDNVKGRIRNAVDTAVTEIEAEVDPGTGVPVTTKTATLAFSISSATALSTPVQGLTLTAILPAGTTVATNTGSTAISSSALMAGSAFPAQNLQLTGTFAADTRKVSIQAVTTGDTFQGGEVAKLVVRFPSTTTLAAADFAAPTLVQAAGFNLATHSTVDLTSQLQAALGITFN